MTMMHETILCIKRREEVWNFAQNLKQVFVSYMKQLQMWSTIIPLKDVWSLDSTESVHTESVISNYSAGKD